MSEQGRVRRHWGPVLGGFRQESRRVLLLDQPLSIHAALWLLCAASILATGYRVFAGADNHALQIPLVLWLNDVDLFPGDRFVSTLSGYTTIVWWVVAKLSLWVPLEPLLCGLFLLRRLLLVYAAAYFASCVAPRSRTAPIAAAAFLCLGPAALVGGGELVSAYFEQTGLALVPLVLALASVVAGRPWAVAGWFALGANLNPMYGLYAATYIGAAWALDPDLRRGPTWGPFLLAAVASLPVTLWAATATAVTEVDPQRWWEAARMLLPYHLVAHMERPQAIVGLALLALLGVTFFQDRDVGHRDGFHRPVQVAWTGIALVWLALSFSPAFGTPPPRLMVLHPARALDLWQLALSLWVLALAARRLDDEASTANLLTLWTTFALLLYVSVVPAGVWVAVALVAGALITWWIVSRGGSSRALFSAAAIGGLMLVVGVNAVEQSSKRQPMPGDRFGRIYQGPALDVLQVAAWARTNTATDAMFQVVPGSWEWSHFRYLARRPVFVTWKDGSALLWDRSYAADWLERLTDLGFDPDARLPHTEPRHLLNRSYWRHSDAVRIELAREHGIDFFVVQRKIPSALPVAFKSKHFKVLSLLPEPVG